MRIVHLLGVTALAGSFAGAAPALARPADATPGGQIGTSTAQSTQQQADEQKSQGNSEIVVTGSRVRLPNQDSITPITTVQGAEFFETGQVSIGDVLNDLPQLRNTFSQQNSTRFLGTRGLNLLDLRGLGTQRTLVLQNGRRHVASDILVNGVSPDINTFPTDLIERVDVVTGGNSSIYGSDAIAGVVNFVLKDKFNGLQIRGQSGVNLDYGDAANQYVSLLAGKNFSEGRGNIAVNLEYAHSDRFFASNRPPYAQNDGFVVTDVDEAGLVNNSDGVPDRQFLRDIRSATISIGGQIAVYNGNQTSPIAPCGRDNYPGPTSGASYTCSFLFQTDGTLIPQTGTRVGIAPNGSFLGGNGYSGREGQLLTFEPQLDRFSANIIGHYDFAPEATVFLEAKYVRTRAFGSVSGPFFSQGATLGGDVRERPRLDNPYLSAQARTVLAQQFTQSITNNINPNATSGAGLVSTSANPATVQAAINTQLAAIAAGTFRFNLRKNWVEFGIRDENILRETFRIVGGLRGDFNDDWKYEVSVNYGEYNENNVIQGNVNVQRYLLAIDTVRDAQGNIRCRSQVDPTAALAYPFADGDAAILARDVAACQPLNPFGDGSSSQAARNYILQPTIAQGQITQFVVNGYVSGDLSQLFELPGGPIAFSIGGEYRRETNRYTLDDLTQRGYAFYNAIPSFRSPAFDVKEGFFEVAAPVLKDLPFFKDLTLNASGRVANYGVGSTGTVFAWSAGGSYAPVQDIRFRGVYSRSIRSPNLGELFSTQSQNFAPGFSDPCSARNIATGSQFRVANCQAAGVPAGYDFVYQQSLEIRSGGNPALRQETGTSITFGGIIEPRWVPGFSLSADYYDISVDNVIASVAAQTIVNQCYDLPTLNNQFCPLFQRAGAAGGPRGEQQFRILEGSLLQSTLNFASLRARGVDVNFNYRKKFSWGELQFNTIWTHVLQRSNYTNPTTPTFENRVLSELGDPQNQINFTARAKYGKFGFNYELRWIDRMYINTYEDYNSLQGRTPENADYATIRTYPETAYHNIRAQVDINDKFNAYFGVDNVGDTRPPFGLTGVGAGSGIYDIRGRYGYIGFVAKF